MFYSMIDFWLYFSNFWTPTVVAPMFLYLFNLRTDIKTYLVSVMIGFVSIIIFRYSVPEDYVVISQIVGAFATFVSMFVLGRYLKVLSHPYDADLAVSRA